MRIFTVVAEWDDEARVWVATSENMPGLVTEAETIEKLHEKLAVMIPDLMDGEELADIPIHLFAEQSKRLRAAS